MSATRSYQKVSRYMIYLWNRLPAAYPVGYEPEPKPSEHRIIFGGRVIIQQSKPRRQDADLVEDGNLPAGSASNSSNHNDLCRSNFLDSVSVTPAVDE